MKHHFSIIILTILIFIFFKNIALAINNPLDVPNNHFGIHIISESDLEKAAELVNSSGGDWGYVTLVIRNDERDIKKWQQNFDRMRELHLIPIVRIATVQTGDGWEKPKSSEIDAWVNFLDNLNWVIKNRYVVIGNEPNHAKEWGGEIDPQGYANYLYDISKKLKDKSDEFFILPAGFDASAPNSKSTMSEEFYIDLMLQSNKKVFDYIDGWVSHSYPNPDFSSSEMNIGKGSIETFKWEMSLLNNLGINNNLPVFITETGWANDVENNKKYLNEITISEKLIYAYENVWNDESVVAITPFVLNYKGKPFDIFSWTRPDGSFYKYYYEVKNIEKPFGKPVQKNIIKILLKFTPDIFSFNNKRFALAVIRNTGQKIWKKTLLQLADSRNGSYLIQPIKFFGEIKPQDYTLAFIKKL